MKKNLNDNYNEIKFINLNKGYINLKVVKLKF